MTKILRNLWPEYLTPASIYLMPGVYRINTTLKVRSGQKIQSLQNRSRQLVPNNPVYVDSFRLTPDAENLQNENRRFYLQILTTAPEVFTTPDRAIISAASGMNSPHLIEMEEGASIDKLVLNLSLLSISSGWQCHRAIISHGENIAVRELMLTDGMPCYTITSPLENQFPRSVMNNSQTNNSTPPKKNRGYRHQRHHSLRRDSSQNNGVEGFSGNGNGNGGRDPRRPNQIDDYEDEYDLEEISLIESIIQYLLSSEYFQTSLLNIAHWLDDQHPVLASGLCPTNQQPARIKP